MCIQYVFFLQFLNYRPVVCARDSGCHLVFQGDDVPLFVGSDVLAASSQLPKNYCRLHSRYAKDGLATKVTFRGEWVTPALGGRVWQ